MVLRTEKCNTSVACARWSRTGSDSNRDACEACPGPPAPATTPRTASDPASSVPVSSYPAWKNCESDRMLFNRLTMAYRRNCAKESGLDRAVRVCMMRTSQRLDPGVEVRTSRVGRVTSNRDSARVAVHKDDLEPGKPVRYKGVPAPHHRTFIVHLVAAGRRCLLSRATLALLVTTTRMARSKMFSFGTRPTPKLEPFGSHQISFGNRLSHRSDLLEEVQKLQSIPDC